VKPLFTLGQVVATPGALAALEKAEQQPGNFLSRHLIGDWGEVPPEDVNENEFSLQYGFRLLSAYRTNAGDKFSAVTEADRLSTCVLLADIGWTVPKLHPVPLATPWELHCVAICYLRA